MKFKIITTEKGDGWAFAISYYYSYCKHEHRLYFSFFRKALRISWPKELKICL